MGVTQITKGSLVEIVWYDAISRVGWFSEEEFMQHEPSVVYTVGYFICEDIVDIPIVRIASSLQDDELGDSFVIPKCLIGNIILLQANRCVDNEIKRKRNRSGEQRHPQGKRA